MTPTQQKFVNLRSEGMSYDKICKQLKCSKTTLTQWAKLFQDDITDLQFLAIEAIKSEFAYNQINKYKQLLEHLKKIDEGISSADLKEASLKDLYQVRNAIFFQIEQMENKTVYKNTRVSETCDIMKTTEILKLKLSEV